MYTDVEETERLGWGGGGGGGGGGRKRYDIGEILWQEICANWLVFVFCGN